MSTAPESTPPPPEPEPPRCLNCGAALGGPYCAQCGQHEKHHVHSTWATITEFIEDLFHADHRVWRTLAPLAFRPGRLTAEYLRGRRVAYTPPFRLYIVLSLLFFLFTSFDGAPQGVERPAPAALDPQSRALIDQLALNFPAAQRELVRDRLSAALSGPAAEEARTAQELCSASSLASVSGGLLASPRMVEACRRVVLRDAGFQQALAANFPKMMFFFLPLIALAGKALYVRSRRYYAEHLLFFVHYHSFFFLAALTMMAANAAATGLESIGLGWLKFVFDLLTFAAVLYIPIYLYLAMRRVYGQGRLVTLVKFGLLGVAYLLFLLLTLIALVILTALFV